MTPSDWARFWAKVDKTDTCWLWTASLRASDYGCFHFDHRNHLAHRIAYEGLVGPVPDGLSLDHLCCVKRCVNPAHLEPVTHQENIRRHYAKITHCKWGHEFPPRKEGSRQRVCHACGREWYRKSRAARQLVSA